MDLLDERDIAIVQPTDEPQLPQGVIAVEESHLQLPAQAVEFRAIRATAAPSVSRDYECRTTRHPPRTGGRNAAEGTVAVSGTAEQWEPFFDPAADIVEPEGAPIVEERSTFEDGERPDVQRRSRHLGVEEAGVEGRHAFEGGHHSDQHGEVLHDGAEHLGHREAVSRLCLGDLIRGKMRRRPVEPRRCRARARRGGCRRCGRSPLSRSSAGVGRFR